METRIRPYDMIRKHVRIEIAVPDPDGLSSTAPPSISFGRNLSVRGCSGVFAIGFDMVLRTDHFQNKKALVRDIVVFLGCLSSARVVFWRDPMAIRGHLFSDLASFALKADGPLLFVKSENAPF